jgi:cell division protein ZapD
VKTAITYEFPLNERIRIFIRIEQLFQQLSHFLTGESIWDKRAAIDILLDILMIFSRNDLKSEILKELKRLSSTLSQISNNEDVDSPKLEQILTKLNHISKVLYSDDGKIGINVMASDLFQSISQRSTIPGGTCSFDLPAFHYWLQQDTQTQFKEIDQWTKPFTTIRTAIDLILIFIRSSSLGENQVAQAGFYQQSLKQSQPFQLLKITVDRSIPCFAEISGGKHRFSVRFMIPSTNGSRPIQTTKDIPFNLTCCQF